MVSPAVGDISSAPHPADTLQGQLEPASNTSRDVSSRSRTSATVETTPAISIPWYGSTKTAPLESGISSGSSGR